MTINTAAGIAALLLGAAYTYQAYHLPRAALGNPLGPVLYPLILGWGMTVLGGMMTIQEQICLRRAGPERPPAKIRLRWTGYGKSIALVIVICLLYALLFERLGYVLATFLFLESILLLFNGFRKWKVTLGVAAGFSIGIYVLFSLMFGIQLPKMPILDI